MVRRKIDNRIRVIIENGVAVGHRTMFVVVGDKGRDQVVILHHMLSKSSVKSRPSVLWCYKKELGFSSHRKKRMKTLQQKIKSGKLNINEDDPFELFVASTNIRYCYYSETHKILGQTYGMCVLQDFEALTPNLLARTIETVEGGGLIVLLLRSLTSLKQLYTLTMDIHERYRTEVHKDVVARFNERFLLSLAHCSRCLVLNDQLTVLPISSRTLDVKAVGPQDTSENDKQLEDLKENLRDTQPVSALLNCCRTFDQGKALLKFIEAISEKTLRSTVSLTASRGRGKSAALGLAVAAAVAFDYSNIFVTSPSPENLNTFFEFVFKGFDALEYQEHLDYDLLQSTNPEFNKAIVRVNIFRGHRQTIQYIHPSDGHKLGHAELVVVDEAAAIPLPLVKSMLGPYLVFLSSTINGYEGTGRSLSLKLLQQLRSQAASPGCTAKTDSLTGTTKNTTCGRILHEITLSESIRYRPGDVIEKWLSDLLCLDATSVQPILSGYPPPENCELYYVNRDTLFCFHTASEAFLQRLVSLYVSSHYKNTPNDLQMMSDAPAHHLFCLLGPIDANTTSLPEIIVVIQVCLEGRIPVRSVSDALTRGKKAAGDLIPWTIAQQYQDEDFPVLSGARIVRIATHPDYQGMGYGSRALTLLQNYYSNKIHCLDEEAVEEEIEAVADDVLDLLEEHIEPRKSLPPLLMKLNERKAERLDYIGVSFGLTQELLKFWKRADFTPVYIRQTRNDLTCEHSCILLKALNSGGDSSGQGEQWLSHFSRDFKRRFACLLGSCFRHFPSSLGLSVLHKKSDLGDRDLTKRELDFILTGYDVKRLEMYSNNLVDYHLVMDLVPALAKFYFFNLMKGVQFSAVQATILLGMGLQHKMVDDVAEELNLPPSQVMGIFNKIMRKSVDYLNSVLEKSIESELHQPKSEAGKMTPTVETVQEDLENAAKTLERKQREELEKLKKENLAEYSIKGSEDDWKKALVPGTKSVVSIKSGEKRGFTSSTAENGKDARFQKKRKRQKTKNAVLK